MTALPLFPTIAGRQLPAARLADRPGQAGRPVPAAGPGPGAVAARAGVPGRGAGRRDAARDPGAGATPASTSSPTARSAGRATPTTSPPRWTASTSTTPARRWTAAGTRTRCRGWSARSAGPARSRCADAGVPAGATPTGPIKVTVPGPFTMSQQAQDDYYGDPRSLALAYAEAVNAGGQGPVRGRRRHRPARRAVPAGPARAGPRVRRGGAQPGAGRRRPARPRCTSASATRRSSTSGRRATRSCPSWPTAPCDQVSIETAQSGPRPVGARRTCRARRSCSACSTCPTTTVETPEVVAERVRRGAAVRRRRARSCSPRDCGMKYLPRASAEGKLRGMAGRRRCCAPRRA